MRCKKCYSNKVATVVKEGEPTVYVCVWCGTKMGERDGDEKEDTDQN